MPVVCGMSGRENLAFESRLALMDAKIDLLSHSAAGIVLLGCPISVAHNLRGRGQSSIRVLPLLPFISGSCQTSPAFGTWSLGMKVN